MCPFGRRWKDEDALDVCHSLQSLLFMSLFKCTAALFHWYPWLLKVHVFVYNRRNQGLH